MCIRDSQGGVQGEEQRRRRNHHPALAASRPREQLDRRHARQRPRGLQCRSWLRDDGHHQVGRGELSPAQDDAVGCEDGEGCRVVRTLAVFIAIASATFAADNVLTDAERSQGWLLLFDGKTHEGWMNSDRSAPRTPVEDGALNPHGAGHYMLVHEKQWGDFVLAFDFKISPHCNSGIFVRTSSLTPHPGKDIGFNGLEVAIDDTTTAGYVDTGALYDLCLLYTSDAADERSSVDLGGRRIIKKKK